MIDERLAIGEYAVEIQDQRCWRAAHVC